VTPQQRASLALFGQQDFVPDHDGDDVYTLHGVHTSYTALVELYRVERHMKLDALAAAIRTKFEDSNCAKIQFGRLDLEYLVTIAATAALDTLDPAA
jgi:hypothetical protein